MNTALWLLQAILAIKCASVAFSHGVRHEQAAMQESIQKMGARARPLLIVSAVLTLLGAVGVIVPAALGVLTWLTPVAAALLALLMLCSIVLHLRCRAKPMIIADVILFAMAAFVAYGRWVLARG